MASSARTSTEDHSSDFEHVHATSTPHSLSKAVHARRAEYTRPRKIKVKIGSWNVAACPGTEKDLGAWFVQGKGIDKRLAGLQVREGIEEDGSQDNVESVEAQESRRSKKRATVPLNDEGTIAGGDEIGLYVLGLQEVVDLASATQYIGRVYTDLEPTTKWRKALAGALPAGYVLVAEQQLSGLLLFVFASPAVAPTISSVSTVSVGTGVMGYLGNKGAVTTRIVLGETTRMVFVNSHLASGNDPSHFERRCWDVTQVLQRTKFDPISWAGVLDDHQEGLGDEDFAFWFGDLNFRLEGLPGDDIRRLLMLHTKGEYGTGSKSRKKIDNELDDADGPIVIHSVESDSDSGSEQRTSSSFDTQDDASSNTLPDPDDFVQDPHQDPASLQATLDSLLPHDQLRLAMRTKQAFHDGWREGPVTFLPTYKYDVGSMGMFDSSEKKRAPSWCDRILFRTRKDKAEYDGKSQEEALAKIRDEEMRAKGIENAVEEEDVLFDYNPDEDGAEDAANNVYDEYDEGEDDMGEAVITKEGYVDRIHLDVYTSHQRVLSSDHKPLDAVFTLEYDAVVPELKAKIHQEVARELDRAENEGRPGITLVVDHSIDDTPQSTDHLGANAENVSVDFGDVAYGQHKTRALTIANTSQVPSTFTFVERPTESGEEDRIAPSWLSVSFASGADEDEHLNQDMKREVTLEPGDVVSATLDLFINDIALVRALNEGSTKLEDVLVLRVIDGRDHFVPIRASWLQSCFGRSIDELIRVPEGGVRALVPPRNGSGPAVNRGQEVCWSAPREIFKLCEAIELLTERVIADANMLENCEVPKDAPGWPFDAQSWRLKDGKDRDERIAFVLEALDSDKNLNDSFPPEIPAFEKLEIMAEVLIHFLKSFKDGVVPAPLWERLDIEWTARGNKPITDVEEKKSWVLDVLSTSPNHNISFVFLTSMLNRVAGELAPLPSHPNPPQAVVSGTRKSLESVRRSLSWKGRAPPELKNDPGIVQREKVEKAYADIFKKVIFKVEEKEGLKDKEKRVGEERRMEVLEAFLKAS